MAVTSDKPTPYAPASVILDLLQRHRAKGLPQPINADVLGRAGVAESLIPRTLQALQRLDLIDDDGKPSEVFEGIRKAPESEYKQRLVEWLNSAYADVIQFVDPAKDDDTAIRDAFRNYIPVGQQERMVSLFTSLYAAAGVGRPEKAATSSRQRAPTPRPRNPGGPVGWEKVIRSAKAAREAATQAAGVPEPVAGMLSRLPVEGQGWTKEKRDAFMTTFGAVLDFCFPIISATDDEIETKTATDQKSAAA